MAEGGAIRERKFLRILRVPIFEFLSAGLVCGRYVLGEELHLLRHAALDDGVVLIEAHRQSLAVENFLANESFNQPSEFLLRRLAMPLRNEGDVQLPHVIQADHNLMIDISALTAIHEGVHHKQHQADQKEMHQRFAQCSASELRQDGCAARTDLPRAAQRQTLIPERSAEDRRVPALQLQFVSA